MIHQRARPALARIDVVTETVFFQCINNRSQPLRMIYVRMIFNEDIMDISQCIMTIGDDIGFGSFDVHFQHVNP